MKKTIAKKIAVTALCVITVMAMSVTAFAAEIPGGVSKTSAASVDITKTLTVTNPDLAQVDGPGMSYSYAIAPATPSADNGGTTVTDADNHTGTVHAGPADGVTLTTSTVNFPVGTDVNASAAGTANKKTFQASTDITKFPAPGIYRYAITETADLGTAGGTDTGDRVRYLDVYITNGADGPEIGGYTLHDQYNNKTPGFEGGSTGAGKPFTGAAAFDTVNITLTKSVTGNMGDKNNQFPFAGTVSDSGRSVFVKKGSAPTTADSRTTGAVSTTLADTETYYISGVSHTGTVTYTETNNTADTYQTSITGGTASAASALAPAGTKAMAATDVDDAGAVTFTNNLDEVSPTGIIERFGPFLAVAMVGAALAMLARRFKKGANAAM